MRTLAVCCVTAVLALADSGQGPADPRARVEGLNLGTYWYGAKVDREELQGKVVLFEIWGS